MGELGVTGAGHALLVFIFHRKNSHHQRFHVWFPKLKSISSQNSKYLYPNNNKAL